MSTHKCLALLSLGASLALAPGVASAHGSSPPEPGASALLTRWDFDPFFILGVGLSCWAYVEGARCVAARHPRAPWPRKRSAFFFAGIGVLAFALVSPPATYDTELFSVHMAQHLLLMMVAAPLLVLSTPMTLALRAAQPRFRREVLLPLLHSRVVRVFTFPAVSWVCFAVAMWGSHFSGLYNASLESVWIHRLEHLLYLLAALMFWWQAIGRDPTPWRMPDPVRLLYVFLQMPQNSFLALSIYNSDHVLYNHYETLQRIWGPSPLADQQLAGVIMWIGGDVLFLAAMVVVVCGWVQHEERDASRQDRELERTPGVSPRAAGSSSTHGN